MEAVSNSIASTVEHSQTSEVHQTTAPTASGGQSGLNSIGDHSSAPQATTGGPTDHSREATTNSPVGYAATKDMVEERLADREDYQDLKETLAEAEQLASDFTLVESHSLCAGDGVLTLADINAVIDDPLRSDDVRAAARRLRDNPRVWTGFAKKGDNRASQADVAAFISGLKSQMKAIKDEVKAEVKEEVAATRTANAAAGGANATGASAQAGSGAGPQAAAAVRAESEASLPKPVPSSVSGLEGASENMNNMIGWGEAEIDRLTTLMSKTDDPAVLKQLENKINQMTRRMQQMTALMNQVMTMMSNISKMYSDIAMNSVRNLR